MHFANTKSDRNSKNCFIQYCQLWTGLELDCLGALQKLLQFAFSKTDLFSLELCDDVIKLILHMEFYQITR